MTRDYVADDLSAAARLEIVDAAGCVVHVVGAGPRPTAPLPPGGLACATPAWRIRVFDAAGHLLVDRPARGIAPH